MRTLIVYMLEVLACSGILLAAYAVLLEKRVRFGWCRGYLLAAPLLAGLIPLLRIPVWPGEVITVVPAIGTGEITAEIVDTSAPEQLLSPEFLCTLFYAAGAVLVLGLMCWQIARIRRLRRGAEIVRTKDYALVRTPKKIASFSFFRSIYVWVGTPAKELEAIVAHEASHIAHRHSFERIGMELLKAAMWWNPFVWIASRRLTETEEFEADSDVLHSGYAVPEYMNAIFKQLFGYSPEIANGLRDSLTKKRFQMMTTQTPSRHTLLRLAGTLPVVIGLLCAFGFTTKAAEIRFPDNTETNSTTGNDLSAFGAAQQRSELEGSYAETQPLPAAEPAEANTGLTPAQPKAEKILHLTLYLKDKDGKRFSTENPAKGALVKIVGSNAGVVADDKGKAVITGPESAVAEISYPGYKTTSVSLDRQEGFVILEPEIAEAEDSAIYVRDEDGVKQTPLYVIDGIERTATDGLDATDIESISILSGESAKALYGDRGRNGVILITSKRAAEQTRKQNRAEEEQAFFDESTGAVQTRPSRPDKDEKEDDAPYLITETMPRFQGGDLNTFRQWVQSHVNYPAEAMQKKVQGRVVLSFIVERDGSVSTVKILQSPDKLFSDEARRVIASSPEWAPGAQKGAAKRVKFTLPVDFRMTDDSPAEKVNETAKTEDMPFLIAEVMPKFQGGDIGTFRLFVQSHIKYPALAMQEKIQGRVVLSFVVEKDGSVSDIQLLQSPDKLLSDEARRVVSSSPAWTPGTQRGKIVRVKYTLPVEFRIFDDSTDKASEKPETISGGTVDDIVVAGFGEQKK